MQPLVRGPTLSDAYGLGRSGSDTDGDRRAILGECRTERRDAKAGKHNDSADRHDCQPLQPR